MTAVLSLDVDERLEGLPVKALYECYVGLRMYDDMVHVFGTEVYLFGDTHHDKRERRALWEVCQRKEPEVILVEAEDVLSPGLNETHGGLTEYVESGRCDVIGIDHKPQQSIVEVTGMRDAQRENKDIGIGTSEEEIAQAREEVDNDWFEAMVEKREENMAINILQVLRERQPSVAVVSVGQNHVPALVSALEFVSKL